MYRGGRGYRDDGGPPPRRDGGYPPRGHPPHPGRGLRGPDLDPAIIREREINRERYLRERERERERFRPGPPGGLRQDDRFAESRDRGWGAQREHPDRGERDWARRDADGDRFRARDRYAAAAAAMDRDRERDAGRSFAPGGPSSRPGGSTRDHSPEEGQIASPPPRTTHDLSPPPRDMNRSGPPSEYVDASEGRQDSSPFAARAWGPGAARQSRDASPDATSRSRSRSPGGSVSDGRTPTRARRPSPPPGNPNGYFAQGNAGPASASPAVRRAYGPGSANSTIPSGPRGMMGFSPHRGGGPSFGGGPRGRGGWGARGGFAPPSGPRGGPGMFANADPPPRSLARKVDAEGMPLASDIPIAHLQAQAQQAEQQATSEDVAMQRAQEGDRLGGEVYGDGQSQGLSQQDAVPSGDSQPGANSHAGIGQGQWTPVGSASSSHSDIASAAPAAAAPAPAPGPPPASAVSTPAAAAAAPTANPNPAALQTPTRPGMAPPRLSFSQMAPNASLSKYGPGAAGSVTPSGMSTPATPIAQTPGLGPQLGSRSQRASLGGTPIGPRGSLSGTPTTPAPPRHLTARDFPRSVAPDLEAELANLSAARLASVHTSFLSLRQPLRSAVADLADVEVELVGAAAKVSTTNAALEAAKLGTDGFIMEENRKESLREAGWAKGLFA